MSETQASEQHQQTTHRMQQQAMRSMHDPELHTPILRQPSISQDQQVVVQLQQVSKELQAAVAQLLAGQVAVALNVREAKMQQAHTLVKWLRKHAGLLQTLDLQLSWTRNPVGTEDARAAVVSQLGDALQQAAAASGPLQLQSLSLKGNAVSPGVLRHLPAAHLTKLSAAVDVCSSASMQAVGALSGLRCLQLSSSDTAAAQDDVLAPLSALQRLTQLHVGTVRPRQLQWVPASVRQLDLAVGRVNARQLEQLADWLREHASIVSAMSLFLVPINNSGDWWRAVDSLVAAFAAAVAAVSAATAEPAASTTAAAGAAGVTATPPGTSWQLRQLLIKSFLDVNTGGRIVQLLPAGTLQELKCSFNWSNAAHISAVCAHTGLRSLHIGKMRPFSSVHAQADDVLAPLSALRQLTQLGLGYTRRVQLQHLQLPQLQHLNMPLHPSITEQPRPLKLDQLTALQTLRVEARNGLQRADRLPPNLCQLTWIGLVTSATAGIQPLLALRRLQQLTITCEDVLAAEGEEAALVAQDLVQLSTLRSLQEVALRLDKAGDLTVDAAAAAAWRVLPLRALELHSAGVIQLGVLQQLSMLQGLTKLVLCTALPGAGSLPATYQQVGLALLQMTRLQDLTFVVRAAEPGVSGSDDTEADTDVEGIAFLLWAICDLAALECVQVKLPVRLEDAAVQQLSGTFAASLPAAVTHFQVKPDVISMISSRM